MLASWNKYLSSLAKELSSSSDRVRDLIGKAHWLTDGHHKEHLLQSVLCRHLPVGMAAGRGFVLDPNSEGICSKEQDILVIDCLEEAPVFAEGGLIIAFPSSVRAAISVKSTLKKTELEDSVKGLDSVRKLCRRDAKSLWTGAFFFDQSSLNKSLPYAHLASLLEDNQWLDMLCAAPDVLYRTDHDDAGVLSVRGFLCGELATGIFIAELIDHLAFSRGKPESDLAQMTGVVAALCHLITAE